MDEPRFSESLRHQAAELPAAPGVYSWIAPDGRILYVGKAQNLRARVGSYFSASARDRRIEALLQAAERIEHEVTRDELDALLRESALIKRLKPPYNRLLLKERPAYYLRVDRVREDPHVEIGRDRLTEPAEHYGPFPSRRIARETLAFLHQVLPIRKCSVVRPRCRTCTYFQMSTCAAPPLGGDFRQRHEEALAKLAELCEGRHDRVLAWLESKRDRLADSLLFEQAADVQERVNALQNHERWLGMLEAAARSRFVVIREGSRRKRFLLVAHGRVASVREDERADIEELVCWVKAHEKVVRLFESDGGELDAAAVLERWLKGRRSEMRWIVVPERIEEEDLRDRLRYVAGAIRPSKARTRRRRRLGRGRYQRV